MLIDNTHSGSEILSKSSRRITLVISSWQPIPALPVCWRRLITAMQLSKYAHPYPSICLRSNCPRNPCKCTRNIRSPSQYVPAIVHSYCAAIRNCFCPRIVGRDSRIYARRDRRNFSFPESRNLPFQISRVKIGPSFNDRTVDLISRDVG